jgi:anti-sigma regulatory factor (Ser/Thr protein kinase)
MLAVCEAATNAIEHAQRPTQPYFDLVVEEREGLVVVVVRDHGRWRDGQVGPHRGRGLVIMRAVADVTVRTDQHGTTVTLCIPRSSNGHGDGGT